VRSFALLVMLIAALGARADILHLKNGDRHYGRLIRADEREVLFEVVSTDGRMRFEMRFGAASVVRVERSDQTAPPTVRASQAAEAEPAEDYEQMLREAFELLDQADLSAALRAMQRVAGGAQEAVLARLDAFTRSTRDLPLPELVARTRYAEAMADGGGRVFKLGFVTPYEREAMARILAARQAAYLSKRHLGRSIAEWAADREAYTELHPAARNMVADARMAAGIIGERLRIDPILRENRIDRRDLVALRTSLTRFVAHVSSMGGFSALSATESPDDPAVAAARRLATQVPTSRPASDGSEPPPSRLPRSLFEDDPP